MKKLLTKDLILKALTAVDAELPDADEPHHVVVVGGAALVLMYDARDTTRDIDALVSDKAVLDAAKAVAEQLDLPPDWLNDGVKGYVSRLEPGPDLLRTKRLVVSTVGIHQLLAMKLSAWRDDLDISNARLLLRQTSGSKEDVWRKVEPHVSHGDELKAEYAFLDLWESER